MKIYFKYLWWIWEMPQLWLGLLLVMVYNAKPTRYLDNAVVLQSDRIRGGISLSRLIIINRETQRTIKHEYGHSIQSRILGPLYLLVIGLPSAIHNLVSRKTGCNYYHFYTEKWANKLGKVKGHE